MFSTSFIFLQAKHETGVRNLLPIIYRKLYTCKSIAILTSYNSTASKRAGMVKKVIFNRLPTASLLGVIVPGVDVNSPVMPPVHRPGLFTPHAE